MSAFTFNPDKFPSNYTNKIIVAQWPCVDRRINYEDNKHMYMYVNINDFLHDNLTDYDGNTRSFDYNNDKFWTKQFVGEVVDIANDPRTEAPYILIDGSLEVIEMLECMSMNFILVVPETIAYAKELLNSNYRNGILPNYTSNDRAYIAMWHFICKKAFRILHTNEIFTNYLFKNNGIIDHTTNRAMNILLNHNKLVNEGKQGNFYTSIGFEEDKDYNDLMEYVSTFDDQELVSEAERMIKDINYIAFESQLDDLCDYEDEYPCASENEDDCDN